MDALNIIDRWPSRRELADDMSRPTTAIDMWAFRNAIAGKFDVALVAAAKRRGIYLTYEELAQTRHRGAPADLIPAKPEVAQ